MFKAYKTLLKKGQGKKKTFTTTNFLKVLVNDEQALWSS
jgi:hypothetical protein